MKNDKFYLAVQENHGGKMAAYVLEFSSSDNIINALAKIKNADFGSIYSTRKRAAEVADLWNECSRRNGVYLYA